MCDQCNFHKNINQLGFFTLPFSGYCVGIVSRKYGTLYIIDLVVVKIIACLAFVKPTALLCILAINKGLNPDRGSFARNIDFCFLAWKVSQSLHAYA